MEMTINLANCYGKQVVTRPNRALRNALKQDCLQLPEQYQEITQDEMCYIGGGISTTIVASIIDIGLIAICGGINLGIKMAGWFGKGALKRTLLKKAPSWARTLVKSTLFCKIIQSFGGDVGTFLGVFSNGNVWVDRVLSACSIGGIAATVLDICDGGWNGQISF